MTPRDAGVLELLRDGTIEVLGRLVASTNNALLCTVTLPCLDPEPDRVTTAVYKRHRLERLFRDVQVLRQQGFVSESRFETAGQVELGLPPDLGFVAL